MNPQQLWDTTMNPETRVLKRVNIDDAKMASDITSLLMGTDVASRRNYIIQHANDVVIDV